MAAAQGWDVSSVLPHLQWGAPIPSHGDRVAQNTKVQRGPSTESLGKGLTQAPIHCEAQPFCI